MTIGVKKLREFLLEFINPHKMKFTVKQEKSEYYLLEVDEPIHIPVGTKVRFPIAGGNDVIHSWWVPALAVKKDAVPGIVNEAWTKAEKVGRLSWTVRRIVRTKTTALCRLWLWLIAKKITPNGCLAKKQKLKSARVDGADVHLGAANRTRQKCMKTDCVVCHGMKQKVASAKPIAGSKIAISYRTPSVNGSARRVWYSAMQSLALR